jgi:hypothetical protein
VSGGGLPKVELVDSILRAIQVVGEEWLPNRVGQMLCELPLPEGGFSVRLGGGVEVGGGAGEPDPHGDLRQAKEQAHPGIGPDTDGSIVLLRFEILRKRMDGTDLPNKTTTAPGGGFIMPWGCPGRNWNLGKGKLLQRFCGGSAGHVQGMPCGHGPALERPCEHKVAKVVEIGEKKAHRGGWKVRSLVAAGGDNG